jgi:hypoxanthine phosphoribosyltransferase
MAENKPHVKTRFVSWSEIQQAIFTLGNRVVKSFKPDVIIAIAKGGLIPARILSDVLMMDEVGYIEVKFYKGVGVRSEKPFIKYLAIPPLKDKNVLIVDDVVDSGRTIQLVIDTLSVHAPRIMKTLVIYLKPWSTYIPDYYYEVTNEWIVFPWEICETIKEGVVLDVREFQELGGKCVI